MNDEKDIDQKEKNLKLDFLLFRRLWHLTKLLFPGVISVSSLILLLLMFVSLLEQYIVYNVGLISSHFYKVLLDRNLNQFLKQTVIAVCIIGAVSIVKGTRQYTSSVLYLAWRQILCLAIHRLYFSNNIYYKINVIDNKIDNPDQRITQDVDKFCNGLSKIIPTVIVSPFVIVYYSFQAYSSAGYLGPVGAFAFFLISTIINKFLMSKIIGLTFIQEQREGDFRFAHMQVRMNAESLAFSGPGTVEYLKTNHKLHHLLRVLKQIINWQFILNFTVNCCDYLGSIFSYILIAILLFSGHYNDLDPGELGALISKNGFIFIYLINSFTTLVDTSVQVTDIAGNAHRIAELIEHLAQYADDKSDDSYQWIPTSNRKLSLDYETFEENEYNPVGFTIDNVSFHPPKRLNLLIKDLTAHFHLGRNILIRGRSSCGKTSLLRVLKGLWPIQKGKVTCRTPLGPNGIFFMPSIPFLTDGSLREQILYPLRENDAEDQFHEYENNKILELLQLVGLSNLVDRIGGLDVSVKWNWYDKLSPGEMQRLNFARLFYHHPLMAVLDEATSATSLDIERDLYEECIKRNITLISVGHRDSLWCYHHRLLQLDGHGGWLIKDLSENDDLIMLSTST